MAKTHAPLNLLSYEVITSNVTTEQVESAIRSMMDWMESQQRGYYASGFDPLVQRIADEGIVLSGSLNSAGRRLDLHPPTPADYQPYNLAEMFRTRVLSHVGGYLQSQLLTDIIAPLDDPTAESVRARFIELHPAFPKPTHEFVRRTLHRISSTGNLHALPSPTGVLPLWACDTYFCALKQDGRDAYLTIKLSKELGPVTLRFRLPAKERFTDGKLTRPTIYLDPKGRIRFGFTVQKFILTPTAKPFVLGVDLGIVDTFVGTVVGPDGYSAPFKSRGAARRLDGSISRLLTLSSQIYAKEKLNEEHGHEEKQDILRIERLRVRSKIARLKAERVKHNAARIVSIAQRHGAMIALEDLAFAPSRTWDRARQQDAIESAATRASIRVKKVKAAYTSQTCPRCGSKVTHSKRATHCSRCVKSLNRDILASRNIALRGMRLGLNLLQVKQFNSAHTRASKPVTPGSVTDYVPPASPDVGYAT